MDETISKKNEDKVVKEFEESLKNYKEGKYVEC